MVQEVAIGRVYLHTVESCLNSVARGLRVELNIFPELRYREFARNYWFTVATVTDGDGAGGNEVKTAFLLENSGIGSTSKGPQLKVDVRSVRMDGIRNLCVVIK